MKKLTYILLTLLVLAGCTGTSRHPQLVAMDSLLLSRPDSALTLLRGMSFTDKADRMYHSLLLADACNKCYDTLPSDSILQEVTDYYDRHGSANEQVRAHYLLGCAYRDMGEAPMALQCYQQAIECADTLSPDCNYVLISRVYGQIGEIFYSQYMFPQYRKQFELSSKYALIGKDTLSALFSYEQQSIAYIEMEMSDSAIVTAENVSKLYKQYGYPEYSAIVLGTITNTLISQGDCEKAKLYMEKYEKESGLFDSIGNIEKGRETYYYFKGNLYLKEHRLDSAEYWYRKEMQNGKDYSNQNAGALGLAMVFEQRHQSDSAAKYFHFAYAMNDSAYKQMATTTTSRVQAMYDYTRHQEIANKEKNKAAKRSVIIWVCIGIMITMFLIAVIFYDKISHKRKETELKYKQSLEIIRQARQDIEKLKAHKSDHSELITEKLKVIREQKTFLDALSSSPQLYRQFAIRGQEPSIEEWNHIEGIVFELYPQFREFMNTHADLLNDKEKKATILIRAGFKPKTISGMLGVSPSYITNIRSEMLQRLFGKTGKPKDFDKLIRGKC